ncbi:MAG: class II aldolase and adducin N-terminal domain-containing protein [Gammaproteobacteria bacterium]|nr:class II aldolase and adducin N-terminal domain-containing protein [Gammaproteobacteria bacterium]
MSISVVENKDQSIESDPYYEDRINLAAAFRMTARLGMDEAVGNHFSYAVEEDGSRFLVNPFGRHFSNMRASDLLLLDANGDSAQKADPTAWAIHGAMHRNAPQARCVMHVHSKYATVLASLADSTLPPIDQNTMRYFDRVAVDDGFDGMGLGDEAERLTTTLGDKRILIMGNHGVMAVGNSIARAFDELFYFERACQTYITALTTQKPLRVASDEVAEKTARQWEEYMDKVGFCDAHLREIREILDREEPDYKL